VLDLEALPAGTLLPSGSTVQGVTFSYAIDGLTMQVVDTFSTTSGTHSLGLTGGDDAFLDGDAVGLAFASPIFAIGMFFVTSDPALAGEILLTTPEGIVGNAATPFQILADGGIAYFIGLVSTEPFTSAAVDFAPDGEIHFAFNVDDVTTALPEPSPSLVLGLTLLGLAVRGPITRSRRRKTTCAPASTTRC
jgi:hypothetical protein